MALKKWRLLYIVSTSKQLMLVDKPNAGGSMKSVNKLLLIFSISIILLTFIGGCIFDSDEEEPTINTPPEQPSLPNPANGANTVALDVDLVWTCSDPDQSDTLSYDVYFGTESDPPLEVSGLYVAQYSPTFQGNTQYYWKVVATDSHDHSTSGPIWSFLTSDTPNSAPEIPNNPQPLHGSFGIPISTSLEWACDDPDNDILLFDIYFDTDTLAGGFELVADHQTQLTYQPEALDSATNYYWKIIAYDDYSHISEGPTWQFRTVSAANEPPDMPQIGALSNTPDSAETEVSLSSVVLSWTCSDQENDDLSYNVYFGTVSQPPLVSDHQTQTSFNLQTLDNGVTYYWRVTAFDSEGNSTTSGLWWFTTQLNNSVVFYYGSPNGDPVTTDVGGLFDVDVYIYTDDDSYIGTMLICLGTDSRYVDSLLNNADPGAEFFFPLNEWDGAWFNDPYEYQPGIFVQSFQGYDELAPPYISPSLHFSTPTKVMTMKMKAVDNSSFAGHTYDAFRYAEDFVQGPTNASDTSGTITFDFREVFNQLHFNP